MGNYASGGTGHNSLTTASATTVMRMTARKGWAGQDFCARPDSQAQVPTTDAISVAIRVTLDECFMARLYIYHTRKPAFWFPGPSLIRSETCSSVMVVLFLAHRNHAAVGYLADYVLELNRGVVDAEIV